MNFKKTCFILSVVALLAACDDDNDSVVVDTDIDYAAIIGTVAPDYSGADVQLVDLSSGDFSVTSGLLPTVESGYTVVGGASAFYHIGKYNIDTISRFTLDSPTAAEYTYSTKMDAEDNTANPYTLIEVSSSKAFLIRYASDKIWVVNPTAASESEFKIDEIDLSAYNDADGKPEIFDAKLVGNQLFVGMQNLDNTIGYPATRLTSYVAVFDVDTLAEVDTRAAAPVVLRSVAPVALLGIALPAQNPISMDYHEDTGILLACVDGYNNGASYSGGIVRINTSTFAADILIDDGTTAQDSLYGAMSNVVAVDADNAFFVGYAAYKSNSLYHFNPTTAAVTGVTAGFSAVDIQSLAVDKNMNTWVGLADAVDPRIEVLGAELDVIRTISLTQNPVAIAFVER